MRKNKEVKEIERVEVGVDEGLNSSQVKERVEAKLVNTTQIKTTKSYLNIIIKNVFTFLNILCFGIAILLMCVGSWPNVGFVVIFLANLIIGLVQEIRAKRIIDKISLIKIPQVEVVRDGKKTTIPTEQVVVDDIIYFEIGKQICADCLVLDGEANVNESLLTGESVAVKKQKGDRLLAGSFVVSGKCVCRVEKVGSECYSSTLVSTAKKYKTPQSDLLKTLNLIIKSISFIIIPLAILTFIDCYDGNVVEAIIYTAGSTIGMIPAGMFLLTSVALAVGVIKLSKRRTLVQDMYSIEMLARTDVLCLDKTGTITDGTMKVKDLIVLKGNKEKDIETVIKNMMASFETTNQTSQAVIDHFGKEETFKAKKIIEFSSDKKYSAVEFEKQGTFALGAYEFVVKNKEKAVEKIINENLSKGMRVLVLCKTDKISKDEINKEDAKAIAVLVISDNIRKDAIETISWFNENGVDIKIISGDNALSVSKISKVVGIKDSDKYISLDGLTDDEVRKAATEYSVFGRVTPEQKCIIVKALKEAGKKVAMTGDGVNDILALKEADCSIAMASGSDATRSASNLVMLDSNFSSMPKIVTEGRRVINNISKSSSLFLMKTFFVMFLTIFTLCSPSLNYPLQPNHILLLETLFIGIPSFFLALQPNNEKVKGTFMASLISKAVPAGLVLTIVSMASYVFCYVTHDSSILATLISVAVTLSGGAVLAKICIPYDWFKAVLVAGLVVACVLVFVLIPDFFNYAVLQTNAKIFIAIAVVSAFILYYLLNWLCAKYLNFDKFKFRKNKKAN